MAIEWYPGHMVTARKEVATAALETVSGQISHPEHGQIAESLVQDFKDRVDLADRLNEDAEAAQRGMNAELQLRLSALAAAREVDEDPRAELAPRSWNVVRLAGGVLEARP